MKKLLWLALGIIVIFYFLSRDYGTSEASASSADEAGRRNHEALVLIRAESKVLEAFISDADVLYVSVADDGTRRHGCIF